MPYRFLKVFQISKMVFQKKQYDQLHLDLNSILPEHILLHEMDILDHVSSLKIFLLELLQLFFRL